MLRVHFLGDGPDNLLRLKEVLLAGRADDPEARRFEVRAAAPGRRGEVRIELAGLTQREAAEGLRGRLVLADREAIEPLPEGEHYWYELVGCRVEAVDGDFVGTVREIWETGAHDVLVIEGQDGRRQLLPAAREFLKQVDVAAGRIVIEAIPGLLDPV